LTIVTRVNNSGGGNAVAANFSQTITNTYQTPDGLTISYHFVKGSGIGLIINPQPGVFGILELKNETNSITRNYNATYSGDCTSAKSTAGDVYGHGVIDIGETKTCIVTNTFQK
jgi:hypothetical protein